MKFSVLSLFPEFIENIKNYSIIGRAIDNKIIEIESINIRDFSTNKHSNVDDYPYGGGPGMLMQAEPIVNCIESVKKDNSKVIYLSAQGSVLTQKKLLDLSKEKHLILLNGHYEGIDNRVIQNFVDEEISIGDYVLTGGELASMVLIDGVSRLIPGVLSSTTSFEEESHYNGLLEYPQYTRPRVFRNFEVPEILLSGNHEKIREYRLREAIRVTLKKRPDLLEKSSLSIEQKKYLDEILKGGNL